MTTDAPLIETERHDEGRILVARLNRPEVANGIHQAMALALLALAEQLETDTTIEAVILTGRGKVFCGGGDVGMFSAAFAPGAEPLPEVLDWMATRVHEALARIVEAGPVLIGAINGPATGAGLGLVCACDLAYARPTAAIRSGFSRLGLSPDTGTTWSLPRKVGARQALKILLSPDPVTAAAAQAMGLYEEVIDVADEASFIEEVLLRTRRLLAPAGATRSTRRLLRASEHRSLREQLQAEQQSLVASSRDAAVDAHLRSVLTKR